MSFAPATVILPLALLAGCATAAPPSLDGPPAAADEAIDAAPVVAGTWSSPACGARTYERKITFEPAATFTAEDRVSPCPTGTLCVWSGIVVRHGTYAVAGGTVETVLLSVEPGRKVGQPFPTKLSFDAVGALVEAAPDGALCVYTRLDP